MLEALLSGCALKTLDLGANGLTGAGVEALLDGLGGCPWLQTLEVLFFTFALSLALVFFVVGD